MSLFRLLTSRRSARRTVRRKSIPIMRFVEFLEQRALMDSHGVDASGLTSDWNPIGPTSASVFALERDPTDDSRLYAGMFFGGLYRSDDASLTWHHLPSPFSTKTVFSVAIDPQDHRNLFVGTFEAGLFRSRDAGQSWNQLHVGLTDTSLLDIAVNPHNSSEVLAVGRSGVFRSTDQGETWRLTNEGLPLNGKSILFDPIEPQVVWVGSLDRGVFRSDDRGATWRPASAGLTDLAINSLDVDDSCGGIYASTSRALYRLGPGSESTWQDVTFNLPDATVFDMLARPQNSAMLLATDAGVYQLNTCNDNRWSQWAPIPARLLSSDASGEFVHVVSTNGRLLATLDEGSNPFFPTENGLQTLFAGTLATSNVGGVSTVYVGTDRGMYYTSPQFASPTPGPWPWAPGFGLPDGIFGVTPHPTDLGTIYVGTEFRGVWKTTDLGSSWTQASDGITPSLINDITQSPTGNQTMYVGTGQAGLFISRDNGQSWQRGALEVVTTSPQVTSVYADPFDANTAYFGTLQGELFKTSDDGRTFRRLSAANLSGAITSIVHLGPGTLLATSSDGKVSTSNDGGVSWQLTLTEVSVPVLTVHGDPFDPFAAYAGTAGGGVYRTRNAGASWQPVLNGLANEFVFAIATDPVQAGVVYAAAKDRVFRSDNYGDVWSDKSAGLPAGIVPHIQVRGSTLYASVRDQGVFVSRNGGNSWSPIATGAPFQGNIPLWISTVDDSTLFAGTDRRGVFRSDNDGLSWQPSSHGMTLFVRTVAIDPINPQVLYAGTFGGGLFRSTDAGINWINIGLEDRNIFKISIDPHDHNTVYAASTVGIARSRDGGLTWVDVGQRTAFVLDLVASAADNGVLFLSSFNGATTNNGVIRSNDGGRTWLRVSSGLPEANVTAVAELANGNRMVIASEAQGIYYSDDAGATWVASDNSLIGPATINQLFIDPRTNIVYAASRGFGVFRSLDAGVHWEATFGLTGDVKSVTYDPHQNSRLYAITSEGLYVSENQGQLWGLVGQGFQGASARSLVASPAQNGTLFAATNQGVYRSLNGGNTWNRFGQGLEGQSLTTIFMVPQAPNVLLVGTEQNGIYRSLDQGATWSSTAIDQAGLRIVRIVAQPDGTLHAATGSGGIVVSRDQGISWSGSVNELLVDPVALYLALDPVNPGVVYATTSGGGVIKSSDGGDNWKLSNNGLTNLFSLALTIDEVDPQTLYVGTAGSGVFVTKNAGETWQPLNNGLFNTNVTALAIDRVNHNIVYAGTEGGSVFAINRGLVDTDEDGVIDTTDVSPMDPNLAYPQLFFRDLDGDGYGDSRSPILSNSLNPPDGYAVWRNDPADDDANRKPAVVPQGTRKLGIDLLALSESGEFNSSVLNDVIVSAAPLHLTWRGIESSPGQFDGPDVALLRSARDVYGRNGIAVSLTVSPLNSGFATLPDDLSEALLSGSVRFSEPTVINRFRALLSFIKQELDGIGLVSLQIGHEIDRFAQVTVDGAFWQGYATFFQSVKGHAESLWGTDLPVGVTWTSDGYTSNFFESLRLLFEPLADMASVTFSPRNEQFRVLSPVLVGQLLQDLASQAFPKPLYFQSVVLPSAPLVESSTTTQSQFLHAFFDFWDTAAGSVPYASFGPLHDLSQEKAQQAGEVLFPETEPGHEALRTAYFQTLGLRTYREAGADKPALATLGDLLRERAWVQAPLPVAEAEGPQWIPIGPENALIFALERDPFDAGTLYAGTYFGGLYRSLDGGFAWAALPTPFAERVVFDIAADKTNRGRLYVATFKDGIYRSDDYGTTWMQLVNGLTDLDVQDIEIDPFNSEHLLAATFAGVFESSNGGSSWTLTGAVGQHIPAKSLAFDPREQNVVLVGSLDQQGVLKSTNGGRSWSSFNTGMTGGDAQRLRFDAQTGHTLFATSSSGRVFRIGRSDTQWISISNGLPNGPVSDIATSPNSNDQIYVATGLGVYRSTNGGATWTPSYVAAGSDGLTISFRLNISPSGIVHAGNLNGVGLVASTDGGATWQSATQGIQNLFVGAMSVAAGFNTSLVLAGSDRGITFTNELFWNNGQPVWFDATVSQTIFEIEPDPLHAGSLLAGTERRGVWRSTDLGVTWQSSAQGIFPRSTHMIAQSRLNGDTLFAGTSSGLWISRDGGGTWNPAESLAIPAVTAIAEDPRRPGTFLFGTNLSEVYRSPDNGFTLILAQGGLPNSPIRYLTYGADGLAYAITEAGDTYVSADDGVRWNALRFAGAAPAMKMVSHPSVATTLWLATQSGGVLRSVDGGQSWNSGSGLAASGTIYDLVVDPNNAARLLATGTGGVYRSSDGGATWQLISAGLPNAPVRHLLVDRTDSTRMWITVESHGLYLSTNGGINWTLASTQLSGDGSVPIVQDAVVANRLLAGPQHGGVSRSNDGGVTWQSRANGISLFVRAIEYDRYQDGVVYAGSLNDGVFRSQDGGVTWRALDLGPGNTVFDLELDPFDSNVIYLATAAGIVTSVDGGVSFSAPIGPLFTSTTDGFVLSLEVSSQTGFLYAATGGAGIWKSENRGQTWQSINEGITTDQFLSLLIDPSLPSTIYAGSVGGGVFVSDNAGMQWRPINNGLFNKTVTSLAIDPDDRQRIYAGTEGGGAFRLDRGATNDLIPLGTVVSGSILGNSLEFELSNGPKARVEFYGEDTVRVRIGPTGTFSAFSSGAVVAPALPLENLVTGLEDSAYQTTIRTDHLTVVIHKSPFHVDVRRNDGSLISADVPGGMKWNPSTGRIEIQKFAPQGEDYFGLGLRGGPLSRRGDVMVMRNTDRGGYQEFTNPLYSSTPFFYGQNQDGFFGLFFDNPSAAFFDLDSQHRGVMTFGAAAGEIDYYVMGGPDPQSVAKAYAHLTGPSPLPAEWTLGYQQSRFGYQSFSEVIEVAQKFRDLQIPADAIYFDLDYMRDLDLFSWDPVAFPDPISNNALLHQLGFRTVNIVDPTVQPDDPLYALLESSDLFVRDQQGETLVNPIFDPWGFVSWLDFSDPDTAEWYVSALQGFLATGVSGVWNDLNEPAQNNMQNAVYDFAGRNLTDEQARNLYALTEVALTHRAMLEARPDERPFILSRSGYSGIQRYAANWSGDTITSFDSLRVSIQTSLHMSLSGQVYFGHDIGGFFGSPSPELFMRWLEFSSFTPFFRNHALNTTDAREPWEFGEPYTSLARNVINQRYQLLPYLYSEAERAAKTGDPILAPLFFHFPNDPQVYAEDDQFMWGDSMLVAPVHSAGTTRATVYLPQGSRWFDWNSGLGYDPGFVTVDAPLGTIPVFVREGGIIPTSVVKQNVEDAVDPRLMLDLFPGADASTYELYEDDGLTFEYLTNQAYRRTRILSSTDDAGRSVTIERIEGDYQVSDRNVFVRFRNIANERLVVTSPQYALSPVTSLADLELRVSGWFYDPETRVLTVKVPGGADRTSIDVRELELGEWLTRLAAEGHPVVPAPGPQDTWMPQGPSAGVVFAMARDPFDSTHLMAGAFFGGLYESFDNGLSWQAIVTPFSEQSVFDVEFDPRNRGVYLVATFEQGVYRTPDRGQTWIQSVRGLADRNVQDIAIDPFDSSILLAATFSGVFKSVDAGVSWFLPEAAVGISAKHVAFDPLQRNVVYLASLQVGGVFRSADQGSSWQTYNAGLGQHDAQRIYVEPGTGVLYVVSSDAKAYRRRPIELSWTLISQGLPAVPFNDIATDPLDSQRLVIATDAGVYVSPNAGAEWFLALGATNYSRQSSLRVMIDPIQGRIHVANLTGTGLVYSDDHGATWSSALAGMQNLFVGAFEVANVAGTSVLYAGTDQGLYYTAESLRTLEGLPWIGPRSGQSLDLGIFKLVARRDQPGTLYAGTERRGVWQTDDWGQTWQARNEGMLPLQTYGIGQSWSNPDVFLAATSAGLWISRDHGRHWNETDLTIPAVTSLLIDPYSARTIYVGTDEGAVYRSIDDGESFAPIRGGLPAEQIEVLEVSALGRLYAVLKSGDLYYSDNRGLQWSLMRLASGAPAQIIQCDPNSPLVVFLGTRDGGLLKSIDGGFSWAAVHLGNGGTTITDIAIAPGLMLVGAPGIMFRSTDQGANWTSTALSDNTARVVEIAIDRTDRQHVWLSREDRPLFESHDGGMTWVNAANASSLPSDGEVPLWQDRSESGRLWAGVRAAGVWTSPDATANWLGSSEGISLFIRALAIDPVNPDVMYAGSLKDGIFRTRDAGRTWQNIGLIGVLAFDVAFDPRASQTIYLATGSGVLVSYNDGASWSPTNGPYLPGTDFRLAVLGLQVDPSRNRMFAATQSGVYRSDDGGDAWQLVTEGLAATAFLSITIDPDNPNTLYVGSVGHGVFVTEDGGESWFRLAENLFSQTVTSIKVDPEFSRVLYIGTEGGGVFRMERSTEPAKPAAREFRMGFTTLPSAFTQEALDFVYDLIGDHGDLVAHSQQEGIPWTEALHSSDYRDYSPHLRQRWETDLAKDRHVLPNHATYLMVNPIDVSYDKLAPYWGADVRMPLPEPFDRLAFNHPDVKRAFTNYLVAAVEFWDPDYLAIGIESNILLAKRPDLWEAYKELNQFAYDTIKALYPQLIVFTTIQYEHMLGLQRDSQILASQFRTTRPNILQEEVQSLLQASDLVSLSTYPYMVDGLSLTDNYYDTIVNMARDLDKPLSIDQTAYISRDLPNSDFGAVLPGSPALQNAFMHQMLELLATEPFEFIVNFNAVDYGTNFGTDPTSQTWAYAGLFEENGTPKPAVATWQSAVQLEYRSSNIAVNPTASHEYFFDQDGDQSGNTAGPVNLATSQVPAGMVIWANDPDDQDNQRLPPSVAKSNRRIGVNLPDPNLASEVWEARVRELGADVISFAVSWAEIEVPAASTSSIGLKRVVDIVTRLGGDFELNLTVSPFDGGDLSVPADLRNGILNGSIRWNDAFLVRKFAASLDSLHDLLPSGGPITLQIGNDVDLYFQNRINSQEVTDFAEFVDQIRRYARLLWGNQLQVASTMTYQGLMGSFNAAPIVESGDFISINYLPVENGSVLPVTQAVGQLGALIARYFGKPIHFQQAAYPSSPYVASSPTKQAQFYHGLFDVWDSFKDSIPLLSLPAIEDESPRAIWNDLIGTPSTDEVLIANIATRQSLGLWRDLNAANGDKPAFQSLRQLTFDRGWWNVAERASRTVMLGLTPFTYDQDPGGPLDPMVVSNLYTALQTDADMVVYHFDKGVPWIEALADTFTSSELPYGEHLVDTWSQLRAQQDPDTRVAVAINPLGIPRDRLAPYWGYGEGYYHDADFNPVPTGQFQDYEDRSLPSPWSSYALNSPQVKQAYLNYAKRVIEFFNPSYLVSGIEVNLAAITDPQIFAEFVELQKYLFEELRSDHRNDNVQISVSFTAEHFVRDEFGVSILYDGIIDAGLVEKSLQSLQQLLPYMDVIGLSLYPQKSKYVANSLPPQLVNGLFDQIRALSDKPIAITESGYTTESFEYENQPYFTDESKQASYLRVLLEEAEKDGNVAFVTNFSIRDIDATMDKLRLAAQSDPPFISQRLVDVFQFFENVGLYDGLGVAKPGLQVWTDHLALPLYDRPVVQPISLASPDGKVVAKLEVEQAGGQISYSVTRQGITFVDRAVVGLTLDGSNLGTGIRSFSVSSPRLVDETYPLLGAQSEARNRYLVYDVNLVRDEMSEGDKIVGLEFRVFDDGVAYRWKIPGSGQRVVTGEPSGYEIPEGSTIWYQQNTANYESEFRPQLIGTFDNTLGGPITVALPEERGYLLLTEAALRNYSGMSYRAFSGAPFLVPEFLDDSAWPVVAGTATPWRVMLVASDLNTLINSTIVPNLNDAPNPGLFPQGASTDYILPGKAVWSWWSDFVSGALFETQKQYIDDAHALGFEYSLIDIYWEDGFPADGKNQFQRLAELVEYGRSGGKDVGLWVWKNWFELEDPFLRRSWMVNVKFAGAVGIKVDNIDSVDSESFENVQLMETILREAAELQLMVNFHGIAKPTGLSRTYPNNIAHEGLMASEINGVLWSQGYFASPRHNAALPFTRFVVGTGDYSPVIFDASKTGNTTFTHQLASAGIMTSPFLVTADHPDNLLAQTEVVDLLSELPTVWDESRALAGSVVGSVAALARRAGDTWYVFVLNGDAGQSHYVDDLDLSFLSNQEYDATFVYDGTSTTFDRREVKSLDSMYELDVPMLAGGGFFARFTPADVPGRTYQLGFTSVPRTTDDQGFLITYNTLSAGDLVTHSFQDGVPWLEALGSTNVSDYSIDLQQRWALLKQLDEQLIPNHDVYLMLNPLRTSYDQLAPYWGADENLPVPAPFDPYSIASDDVKRAFTNYVIAAIEYWNPKYVAIGVEANIFLAKRPDLWEDYKELNAHVYTTVKALYPQVTVLTSVHYEHMLGLQEDSKNLREFFQVARPNILQEEVEDLLRHSDAVAWSTYPYTSSGNVVTERYYDQALFVARLLDKQVAIDQTGYTSQDFTIDGFGQSYFGSPQLQAGFVNFVLDLAQREEFLFVNNFVSVDYGDNYGAGVPLTWAYTGMLDMNLQPKPAFDVWKSYVAAPYTGEYPTLGLSDRDGDGLSDQADASPDDARVSTTHLFYRDRDGDGLGDSQYFVGAASLTAPDGFVAWSGDLNDNDSTVGATALPLGTRRFGLEFIEQPESGSFGANLATARGLGANVSSLHLDWNWIEPHAGAYVDPNAAGSGVSRAPSLAEVNTLFPQQGFGLSLTLRPVNSQHVSVPSDLVGKRLNDPLVVQRFVLMLNFVMQQLPDIELYSLQIGNEIDLKADVGVEFFDDYADFLRQVSTYIRTPREQGGAGYFGHAPFPIGTSATLFGLLLPRTKQWLASSLAESDMINVTYYPTGDDFVQKDPYFVERDLAQLVAAYPNKPIFLQEAGYASDPRVHSSDVKQAQFFHQLMQAWDRYAEHIPYVQVLKLYDSSQAIADQTASSQPFNTVNPRLSAFLRTLGLRTYGGAGQDKPALQLLGYELSLRQGILGDLNGDQSIDAGDAGVLFGQWGQVGINLADLNRDGIVDAADAGIVFAAWTGDSLPPNQLRGVASNSSRIAEQLFEDNEFLDSLTDQPSQADHVGALSHWTSRSARRRRTRM